MKVALLSLGRAFRTSPSTAAHPELVRFAPQFGTASQVLQSLMQIIVVKTSVQKSIYVVKLESHYQKIFQMENI